MPEGIINGKEFGASEPTAGGPGGTMLEENYTIVTEEDLLRKVSDTENNFIERKTERDHHGWLKTAVAFANSCPVGQPGILYVGVDDNGMVRQQAQERNFEDLEKEISGKVANAWPPIYINTHILAKDGAQFIAVVVYGSPLRPHFSGPAYVRIGPETKDASEEQYDLLIAERSSKFWGFR
jgi:predicted HTH transcriptional regulator